MTLAATRSTPDFDERVATRQAKVGIVGLGYAGLPLALAFCDAGFAVTAVDVNEQRVADVTARRQYLADVPPERYPAVDGRLTATTDYAAIAELDALTICVPTPLSKTHNPDLSYVVSAAEGIARQGRTGQLIVLQSTTRPGTTVDVVLPLLERELGRVGRDFFLGYAPERVDPGNPRYTIRTTPKLVAGVTEECLRRTALLYGEAVDTIIPTSSTQVAEMAKLHENTFRAVNIGLANELAIMCDRLGISAWEVIEAASSKPFGFMAHYPGPGIGGDCIPVVPLFLVSRMRELGYSAQLIRAAHEINSGMQERVVHKVADALNDVGRPIRGSRILVAGVAYKPEVSDVRESPSLPIMRGLAERGAIVEYCDPHVPELALDGAVQSSEPWTGDVVAAADCVILLTAHQAFADPSVWDRAQLVVDTRNVVPDGPAVRLV